MYYFFLLSRFLDNRWKEIKYYGLLSSQMACRIKSLSFKSKQIFG